MYQLTFLWNEAKMIPYIAFIWWGFIAENLVSLCSNKAIGNSFCRRRGGDTKLSRRRSQKNNRGFVLVKEAFATSSLNKGFRATVKQQEWEALCDYMVGALWTATALLSECPLSVVSDYKGLFFSGQQKRKKKKKRSQKLWVCWRSICTCLRYQKYLSLSRYQLSLERRWTRAERTQANK